VSTQPSDDISDAPRPGPKRLRRWVCRILKVVIVTLAIVQVFNIAMRLKADAEARKIADTEYGQAFESADYIGDGDAGVLLFHGLHGTPRNFQAIMTSLEERGIHYYAPMLGGYRVGPAAGLSFDARRFAADAERAYKLLSKRCKRIVVAGHSFGSLQATDVASRYPVAGLVVVSPAYRITQRWYLPPSLEAWVKSLSPVMPLLPKFSPARMNDPSGLENYSGFMTFSLQSVSALIDYSDAVLARADKVQAPVLGLITTGDEVIDIPSARAGVKSLGSTEKRIVGYTRSNHMILLDYDRRDANEKVLSFIDNRLDNMPQPSLNER